MDEYLVAGPTASPTDRPEYVLGFRPFRPFLLAFCFCGHSSRPQHNHHTIVYTNTFPLISYLQCLYNIRSVAKISTVKTDKKKGDLAKPLFIAALKKGSLSRLLHLAEAGLQKLGAFNGTTRPSKRASLKEYRSQKKRLEPLSLPREVASQTTTR